MMPFMLNTTNTGSATPQMPPVPVAASAAGQSPASAAIRVEMRSIHASVWRLRSLRLMALSATTPRMFTPKSGPYQLLSMPKYVMYT